jgi:hypothetical protein
MQFPRYEFVVPRDEPRAPVRRPRPTRPRPRPRPSLVRVQRLPELPRRSRDEGRLDPQQYLRLEFTVDDRR